MTRIILLALSILIGCSAKDGKKCAKPEDCADGQTCGKDWKCFDPVKAEAKAKAAKDKAEADAKAAKAAAKLAAERRKKELQAITAEATTHIRKMADSVLRLSPADVPSTIETPPHKEWLAQVCKDGKLQKFKPDANTWAHPTWKALNFSVNKPFYYKYTFASSGKGASTMFTAQATGDLDCDGVFSTFEISGKSDSKGEKLKANPGIYMDKELE